MRLLYQAWTANDLTQWTIATAILLGVLLVLAIVRYGAARLLQTLSVRTATIVDGIAVPVVRSTKLWLLLPVAVYAGASVLELPARLERVLEVAAVLVLMLQVALWASRFIRGWLQLRIKRARGVDGETVTALELIAFMGRAAVWAVTLLLVLDYLGFEITTLIAGLGIGGIAVALAAQNILGDLFASLSIVLDKPFVVGDFIIVDDLLGEVQHIGIKSTRVRSLGGELLIFSNTDLLKSRIRNYRRMHERRVLFRIAISYETPTGKVERVPAMLREIVEAQQKTRFDRAHFQEFGEFALNLEVVYYVLDRDYNLYMDIQQAINYEILRRFREESIGFALPARTLYLRQADGAPDAGRGE